MTSGITDSDYLALSKWCDTAPKSERYSRTLAFCRILRVVCYKATELDLSDLDNLTSLPLPLPIPTLKTLIISRTLLPSAPVHYFSSPFLKFPTKYELIIKGTSERSEDEDEEETLNDIVLRPMIEWCYHSSDNGYQLFEGL